MRALARTMALAAVLSCAAHAFADVGAPVGERTYFSSNRLFSLEVDPRWDDDHRSSQPLLTLRRESTVLWQRGPHDFADFRFPLDVEVSDDGQWLVFGGYSAHNISFDPRYEEGLRFYSSDGKLIRFVSRHDLPVGEYGISTSAWYDAERTRLEGTTLRFFTPGRPGPLLFDVTTGELLRGRLVPGQGDDSHHMEWLRRQAGLPPNPSM